MPVAAKADTILRMIDNNGRLDYPERFKVAEKTKGKRE
jgi:hypothetical protein